MQGVHMNQTSPMVHPYIIDTFACVKIVANKLIGDDMMAFIDSE